jgi:alpha-N-arabinofuranosidase
MQCDAPLLVNVSPGARQWRPDMIGYDALSAYGSPSDYAFQMFSTNVGDEIQR